MTEIKSEKLNSILKELSSFVIAFSGGVDSSFLLHRAHSLKKLNIIAVTIRTPYIPAREIAESVEFAEKYGIRHKIIDIAFPEIIRDNPNERCYLCKKTLFNQIILFASENKFRYIVDGTNHDDKSDYRPGLKALKELGVRSPLSEAGLTKSDIRELSKNAGLVLWDKPAMACMLTRIPYNTEITEGMLRMIENAENFLFDNGFPGTRVRIHGDVARIECLPGYIERISHEPFRTQIISNLKKLGFRYISLDMEGYRSGSMNS